MINRRQLLSYISQLFAIGLVSKNSYSENSKKFIKNTIPSSKQELPAIGMGTWITFNVGNNKSLIEQRRLVLQDFFNYGGELIDSSPMYGSSEKVVGECLQNLKKKQRLFSATKVWTPSTRHGKIQIENSLDLWKIKSFSLLQVHNLVNVEKHLEHLTFLKDKGIIKYIGVTTSHGRRHDELESIIKSKNLDFVQFTYNILDDEAERTLLPLSAENNLAVIINRPFRRGQLFDLIKNKPFPEWAKEYDISNWPEFFLKFIISHPSVTSAIPATSKRTHMLENMNACYGMLPDENLRIKMKQYFLSII